MNIKLTEQTFQNLVSYWAGKLLLPLPLFNRNNRMIWVGHIHCCEDCEYYTFTYNFKRLKILSDPSIMNVIFHELGHIKNYKKKFKELEAEYIAERFALDCIKKHYPDYLDKIIEDTKELLRDKRWCKQRPVYAKVFKMIKEYKED